MHVLGVFPEGQKSDSLELDFQAMASHPPIDTENVTTHATTVVQRPQESKSKVISSYHVSPK